MEAAPKRTREGKDVRREPHHERRLRRGIRPTCICIRIAAASPRVDASHMSCAHTRAFGSEVHGPAISKMRKYKPHQGVAKSVHRAGSRGAAALVILARRRRGEQHQQKAHHCHGAMFHVQMGFVSTPEARWWSATSVESDYAVGIKR